ncbi:MAG: bifunctional diaminohydroxyphosphoribosylaminopyrimidine deaminase/5-amino-6-(5-phosphoribosylamino)uracil reductase RibD [Proteobacteria bacterium]|nr:bifunctional diaminohydroxyphosphoribosylaminopyrimidine deaminase/5-amino-6-(5-phosphoribosylamino)uracil reductase RibD [Pseudomonadota bacterium]
MTAALNLARRGLGTVWPNPSVGCVLVNQGLVVGRGWTQPGGRPHGETEALRRAGSGAKGATAYVSLEPCAHHGETAPCVDALMAAGVRRVVVATEDPDPRVRGRGMDRLREFGIEVIEGVCRDAARALNAGFFNSAENGLPLFTLKTATSLDGRIATASGQSKWITGEAARLRGHGLRADHDAVMVGIGTVLADDPSLDCRLPGLAHRSPVPIVVDSRLRLPSDSRLARNPTWILTLAGDHEGRREALAKSGVEIIEVAANNDGQVDLFAAARALCERGLTRVLVEGGARLNASLLRENLIDRLVWFRNPRLIGGDGLSAVAAYGIEGLDGATAFRRQSIEEVGDDVMETYERIT